MAATTKSSKMVTTGVCEELHEVDWEIKNWELIQVDKNLVLEQKFEMTTGKQSSVLAKFLVGLKVVDNAMTTVYCKLVELTGSKTEIPVSFSCTIANVKDGGFFWQPNPVMKSMKVGDVCDVGSGWTFNQSPIPDADKFLIDGSLKIGVKLRVLLPISIPPSISPSMKQFQEKSAELVKADFGKLLEKNQYADLKIVSSDKMEFPCHRAILSARNPVFATMLATDMSENKSGVINLPDLSGKTVEILLHYLYTGQLLDTWNDPEVIVELVLAADAESYQIPEILDLMDNLLDEAGDETSATSSLLKLNLTKAMAELKERAEFKLMAENLMIMEVISLVQDILKSPGETEKKDEEESEKDEEESEKDEEESEKDEEESEKDEEESEKDEEESEKNEEESEKDEEESKKVELETQTEADKKMLLLGGETKDASQNGTSPEGQTDDNEAIIRQIKNLVSNIKL